MWEILINGLFIYNFSFNDKLINNMNFHRTKEDQRKVKISFKVKYFYIKTLSSKYFYYVFNCDSAKEVWETLEMIFGVFTSIKPERMTTKIQEVGISNEYNSKSYRCYS